VHPLLQEERHFFGMTHVEMGQVLCLQWQLPAPIVAVAACHHVLPDPGSPYYPYRAEIAIVAFANYTAWLQGISSISHAGPPQLSPQVFELLPIEALELESLLQETDKAMQAAQEFYSIAFPDVNRLRARLLQASITMSRVQHHPGEPGATSRNISASLTAPHQSLDPAYFVPWTLETIKHDFEFDRVILFSVNPQRRSLAASHAYPEIHERALEIDIGCLSGMLLDCLREKKAVLIDAALEPKNPLLKKIQYRRIYRGAGAASPLFGRHDLRGLRDQAKIDGRAYPRRDRCGGRAIRHRVDECETLRNAAAAGAAGFADAAL